MSVQIYSAIKATDGAGVNLNRVIGQPQLRYLDPFLMLDHFSSDDPDDYIQGFPPHPHRGFETLTYMLHGKMEHKDSTGGHGLISTGGLQWMRAGSGVIHSEMPMQQQGKLSGFQFWLNLEDSLRMSDPFYVDIPSEDIPTTQVEDGLNIKVLAGNYQGLASPMQRQDIDLLLLDISLNGSATFKVPVAEGQRRFVFVHEGTLTLDEIGVKEGQLAVLSSAKEFAISSEGAKFVFAQGNPLNQPFVQHGPFVMGTHQELEQAIIDYQNGQLVKKATRSTDQQIDAV